MRRFKMLISTQTYKQNQKKKTVATNENCTLRKMVLNTQNPNFNNL